MKFEAARKQFLQSERGVDAANQEFETLRAELERLIESVKGTAGSISLHLKVRQRLLVLLGLRHGLSINWEYHYRNSLDGAEAQVALWDGHPPFPGTMPFENPMKLRTVTFKFDLLPSEQIAWVSDASGRRGYSTSDLASFILKYYMDNALQKQHTDS